MKKAAFKSESSRQGIDKIQASLQAKTRFVGYGFVEVLDYQW